MKLIQEQVKTIKIICQIKMLMKKHLFLINVWCKGLFSMTGLKII